MELMDESLTQFLGRSNKPLPYHTEVNLCLDIALALSYLHSNGIVHRDLSSNNVLLIAGSRAKVTDFGMVKLYDVNRSTTHLTPLTLCPGTTVYMSPEALGEPPMYTDKLDSFSLGVLCVQIMTRQFPDPGEHFQIIEINDPRIPSGRVQVEVPEIKRRQSHIDLINPAHPLLPVALDCLKDRDRERPSCHELCGWMSTLKASPKYTKSVQQSQVNTKLTESANKEREIQQSKQIRDLQQQLQTLHEQLHIQNGKLQEKEQKNQQQLHQILGLRTLFTAKEKQLAAKDDQLASKDHQIQREEAAHQQEIQQLRQQLQSSEQVAAEFQQNLLEREKMIQDLQRQILELQQLRQKGASTQKRTGATKTVRADREPQFNHHIASGEICFLGDPWQETVTSAGQVISWTDIGIKIIIPPGAIPEDKPITVTVRPCLSGPFELPEDYELASPVYAISPALKFSKDIKLFMAHFADLQSEDDCKNMTFLTTESSSLPGDSHPYRLLAQNNGVFKIGSRKGEISLKHFCKKAIGRKCKQDGNEPRESANQSKISRNKKQEPKLDSKDKQGNVEENKGTQNLYAAQLYQNEGRYHFNNTAAVTVTLQHPVYILNFTKCLEYWYPPPFHFVPSETSVNFSECKAIVEIPTDDETGGWKIIPDVQPCEISKEAVDLPISKPDADYTIARTYPPKILLIISPPADKVCFRFCQLPISGFTKEVKFTLQLNPSLRMVTPLSQLNRHGLLPSITDCETEHLSFTDRPTVRELITFQGRRGKTDISEQIGNNYKRFGILLLDDPNGVRVNDIERKHHEEGRAINLEILQKWLEGSGKKPMTWKTLIDVLFEIGLTALANDIKAVKLL